MIFILAIQIFIIFILVLNLLLNFIENVKLKSEIEIIDNENKEYSYLLNNKGK